MRQKPQSLWQAPDDPAAWFGCAIGSPLGGLARAPLLPGLCAVVRVGNPDPAVDAEGECDQRDAKADDPEADDDPGNGKEADQVEGRDVCSREGADGGDEQDHAGGESRLTPPGGDDPDEVRGDHRHDRDRHEEDHIHGDKRTEANVDDAVGDEFADGLIEGRDQDHPEGAHDEKGRQDRDPGAPSREMSAEDVADGEMDHEGADDAPPDVDGAPEVGGHQIRREDLQAHHHRAEGDQKQDEDSVNDLHDHPSVSYFFCISSRFAGLKSSVRTSASLTTGGTLHLPAST